MAARILIVDDDKMTRVALEAMLRNEPALASLDVAVTSAEDGHAGLAALAESPPDVAIVDLLMPRLDGFETCKALRGHPRGLSIELCVISGVYRDAAIEKRVESELGARFFAKPDGLRELIRHVGDVLQRRQGGERKARARTSSPPPPRPPAGAVAAARAGDLALRPLAAVLLDLHEAGATGRLTLRHGRIVKTIELAEGNPVGAATDTRDETLGHFLVGAGIIAEEQHKQAVTRAVELGETFGEALVALGLITPARLAEMLTAQVRHKLVSALRWPQGAWRFQPGAIDPARDGLRLRMVDVVLGGLQETSTPATVQATLDRLGAAAIDLTARGKKMAADIRRVFGARVPDVLGGGGDLGELEAADADLAPAALHAALDALAACDAIATRLPALGPAAARPSAPKKGDFRAGESTQLFIEKRLEGTVPDGVREPYEQLFEDSAMTPLPEGEAPLELDDDADSGVIDLGAAALDEATRARQALLKEYLRVQGLDPYAVLLVDPGASAAEISAALAERQSRFSRDYYARFNLAQDAAKLDTILSAYERARDILLDDARRAALDRELAGGELTAQGGASLDAELAYRAAEDLLARGAFPTAIARLQAAVAASPGEANYHAALGWAHWQAGGGDARAADLARPHLNQALALAPDHGAAHEYKGRIDAALGTDDLEALFHLERALALDPARPEALTAAEQVYLRRGEVWPLVRLYRRVLHHLRGRGALEAQLWARLAVIHRDHLDDRAGARAALAHARKIAPTDPAIAAAHAALEDAVTGAPAADPWVAGVARWRRDLSAPGPGLELMRWAETSGRPDAAYLAASALLALGHEHAEAEALYQRWRPRFVVRAQRALPGELWHLVRHPDDSAELGALMELAAPAVHAVMPMTLDDLEVDDSLRVPDGDLPDSFRRLRAYLAGLLGTREPDVYVRTDFGRMLHVGALAEPVILAGDDALANPERAELAFRLARAMTFVWPGRAAGGSRPARVLKALTVALLAEASPAAAEALLADDADGWIARAREALGALTPEARAQGRALALRLVGGRAPHLNLSRWARALSRTADRVGLLVCGDLPAARRYAADGGATGDDLVEFALGPEHLRLRVELGLSIDV